MGDILNVDIMHTEEIEAERARKKDCQMGWDALNNLTDPLHEGSARRASPSFTSIPELIYKYLPN